MLPPASEGWEEIRFTFSEVEILKESLKDKEVYKTPEGFADIIPGIRIFTMRDVDGHLTGEYAVYVRKKKEDVNEKDE